MTGVNMETGRARYDIDKWSFTNVEDRRRYTEADPGRLADGTTVPDYTGTEVDWCPGIAAPQLAERRLLAAHRPPLHLHHPSTARTRSSSTGDYTPGEGYAAQSPPARASPACRTATRGRR